MTTCGVRVWGSVLVMLALGACGDGDKDKAADDAGAGSAGSQAIASDDDDFDACLAKVEPVCKASEHTTAESMETPCMATEMIPIPLSDGGMYGPVTLEGGPYGGAVLWNEGADTEFVNPVNASEQICIPIGIDTFMEPKAVSDDIKNLRGVDHSLYTVFHPACMKKGEKYPVITWANGTCGEMAGYVALLGSIASHGFVIIAANSTWTNTGNTKGVQLRALDYAEALNADPSSILHGRLDLDHVGAMGHSQGAAATAAADDDPRIDAVIFWNSGDSDVKPYLNVSGDRDVGNKTLESMQSGVAAAKQPGAYVYYHQILETGGGSTGHLVLMEQPDRVVDMAVAWWKWRLNDDQEAKKMFVGDDCGLCNQAEAFDYGHNELLK
jgi:hypothetical protein